MSTLLVVHKRVQFERETPSHKSQLVKGEEHERN